LFFHDVINQTHGLLLFLNQRQSQKQDIKVSEIALLESEVRTLQSLIKDHFNFKHKNLASTYDWVPFSIAELSLIGLIQTYLPNNKVQTFIHLDGSIGHDKSVDERENAFIYFPVFYRIMNNLIKNMAEANSSEVHFYFNYGLENFSIETRNKINGSENLKNISDKLAQIILDDKPTRSGLGLESIYHLAAENGGTFDFEIANDMWVSRISLPKMADLVQPKKAA
ncbi:MAG: GHKL domain-containing protein, partial [Alphaproteobacteria bacterium]